MKPQRVVVGLSGGVDSAVTAWLLKQQGHEVIGIFMKNWEDDDRPGGAGTDDPYCSSAVDFVDAAAVADVIGIEIEHVNFAADYKDRVFAEFLREYEAGRTPNPDVLCNAEIKFKAFLDHALRLGAEKIATGHYARVRWCPADPGSPVGQSWESNAVAFAAPGRGRGSYQLLKGLDPLKDQSYFLHRLTQAQLSKTLFPIGELPKTEVRRLAAEIGLPNAAKKDSTGICFIGERPFREFLNRYLSHQPGAIVDDRGRTLGRHVGLSFYTLGQRQGLGIGGVKEKGAARGAGEHAPWFVARKDLDQNTLVVVQGHDHPWLLSATLQFDDASWVAGTPPPGTAEQPAALAAKARYRQADAPCQFEAQGGGLYRLAFAQPQWAVTPGQSAVLYDGEVCLGGGVITGAA
jgi:tRNA-specific 2-thiouridylase